MLNYTQKAYLVIIKISIISKLMLRNLSLSGKRKVGYIKMIQEAGSNGIVDIIWVGVFQKRIKDRSKDGKQFEDILFKLSKIAESKMNIVVQNKGKLSFIGLMIVGIFSMI
jgi:hypothetical protein